MTTITLFTHEFPPILLSGVGNTVRFLYEELLNQGFEVNVVTLKFGKYSNLKSEEIQNKLKIHRIQLPFYERLLFSFSGGFFSWFNRDVTANTNLIHSLDTRDAPFIYKNAPLIVNVNDYIPASTPLNPLEFPWPAHDKKIRYVYYNFTKIIEYISLKRADIVIPNSEYTCNIISKKYKVPKGKIKIIKKGVNADEFRGNFKKENDVLLVGGNLQGKGIDELINAASVIAKNKPDIKFTVVGRAPDSYMQRLYSLCEKKNVRKNIEFIFHLSHEEIIMLFLKSKIFVLPTYRDSLPQVILEAMAAKLPVIATNVGGIPEAVVDKETGFLVNVHDVHALIENINYLLDNQEEAVEIGNKGYERVLKYFNYKDMVKNYIKLYKTYLS